MAGNGASLNVGASTSSFNSAMKQMVSDMKNVQSEFNLASTQAKLFGTETDNLKAKQTQLTSAISIQNNMVNTYSERIKTVANNIENMKTKQTDLATKIQATNEAYKQSVSETGKDSEASKALSTELDQLNKEYTSLDKSIASNSNNMNNLQSKMNSTKASLLDNNKALEETNNKLKVSGLEEFSTKMGKVSDASGKVASALTPASLAIGGIATASEKASIDFETDMAQISTIADESQVSMGDMKQAILDLSNQTGISAHEVANNVYEAISSGVSTADSVQFVGNATKLASAGFTDLASAGDVLTSIMNAYGLSADNVDDISNKLIVTQNLGKTKVNDLAQSMGKVIPVAHETGVDLAQLGSAYAVLTSKGIDTAESTTTIKAALTELSKGSTTASTALKQFSGYSFQELIKQGYSLGDIFAIMKDGADKSGKSMTDLFANQEAVATATNLATNAGKDFDDILSQMNNSAGATDTAYEKMTNTSGFKLKVSFNELENSAIKFGDALAPAVSKFSGALSNLANFLGSLNQQQLETIANIAMMVVGFTGAMKVISVITGSIGTLAKVLVTVIGWFTKLGGIEGIILRVMYAWEGFTGALATVGEFIGTAFGIITEVIATIGEVIAGVVTAINPIVWIIAAVIAGFVLLYNYCDTFRNSINSLGEWIANFFTQTIPQAFNSVVTWFSSLPAKFSAMWVTIKQACSTGWNTIVSFFTTTIPAWIDSIGQWFLELPNKIGYALGYTLGTIAKWGVETYTYLTTNVPIWIESVVTYFSQLPDKIWTWLTNVVTNITTWGINILNYITTNVPIWINNIVTYFTQLPSQIWTWLVNVVTNLDTWGTNVITWISTNVSTWITNIVNYFTQLPDKIWAWLVKCVTDIGTWGTNMLTKATECMQNVYNGIVSTFTNLPSDMLSIGENIVKGMWEGIENSADWLMSKVKSFAKSVISGFKDAFDIHSPSRIMRDLIGTNIVKGISVGVDMETPNLTDTINSNINGVINSLDQTVSVVTTGVSNNGQSNGSISSSNDNTNNLNNTSTLINKILDKMDTLVDAFNISIDGQSIVSYTSNNLALSSKKVR